MISSAKRVVPTAKKVSNTALNSVERHRLAQKSGEISFVEQLRALGPEAQQILVRLTAISNSEFKVIQKAKGGKPAITRGATLREVYGNHPKPFNALIDDCQRLLTLFRVSNPLVSELVVGRVFSDSHQFLDSVYQRQLLTSELRFALAIGLLGPRKKVGSWDDAANRAVQNPNSKIWGNATIRKALNATIDNYSSTPDSRVMYGGKEAFHKVFTPLEVLEKIAYWQGQLQRQFLLWGDKPCIKVFGTARDKAVSKSSKDIMDKILPLYLKSGVSLISGLGDQGIMGAISSRARQVHQQNQLGNNVIIGGTPLRFLTFHGTEQTDTVATTRGAIAPGQISFESRTPLLYALGLGVGNFFFPGGFGTDEEKARIFLSQQLREMVTTAVPAKGKLGLAPNFLIDQPSSIAGSKDWFWAPDVQKIKEVLAAGTVSEGQIHPTYVIRIGKKASGQDPEKMGALEVHYFSDANQAAQFIFAKSNPFIKNAERKAKHYRKRVSDALEELRGEGKIMTYPKL